MRKKRDAFIAICEAISQELTKESRINLRISISEMSLEVKPKLELTVSDASSKSDCRNVVRQA